VIQLAPAHGVARHHRDAARTRAAAAVDATDVSVRLNAVGSRSLTRGRERRHHVDNGVRDPPWLEYDTGTTPGRTHPMPYDS